ncbi:hypothetical protein L195_g046847 [Trifolium pratense]|uniref:Uncharacterized protein n=1 Tax=Trifolium pratense TaxID=57577 RepID=A0A2K3MIW4_TRIPR|nr:hypothetical protein L195_g046847 [Trifolium pratense]
MAAPKLLFDGPSFDLGIEQEISQPLFDGPSFNLGIEDMENNQQVKKTESTEIEFASKEMNENHGLNLEIVEPYDGGFLDLNRSVFDLNKFPNDGLEFGFAHEELNKEFHNMLKIFLDSVY